jgi:hypothetical protein
MESVLVYAIKMNVVLMDNAYQMPFVIIVITSPEHPMKQLAIVHILCPD